MITFCSDKLISEYYLTVGHSLNLKSSMVPYPRNALISLEHICKKISLGAIENILL